MKHSISNFIYFLWQCYGIQFIASSKHIIAHMYCFIIIRIKYCAFHASTFHKCPRAYWLNAGRQGNRGKRCTSTKGILYNSFYTVRNGHGNKVLTFTESTIIYNFYTAGNGYGNNFRISKSVVPYTFYTGRNGYTNSGTIIKGITNYISYTIFNNNFQDFVVIALPWYIQVFWHSSFAGNGKRASLCQFPFEISKTSFSSINRVISGRVIRRYISFWITCNNIVSGLNISFWHWTPPMDRIIKVSFSNNYALVSHLKHNHSMRKIIHP